MEIAIANTIPMSSDGVLYAILSLYHTVAASKVRSTNR